MFLYFLSFHLILLFFFFFQAEDGIRDIGVTGVLTCALPISTARAQYPRRAHGDSPSSGLTTASSPSNRRVAVLAQPARSTCRSRSSISGQPEGAGPGGRSEERRVGKECRVRWAAEEYKKREE